MRQAVAEICQGQQERIRQVKNECIDVVNACYDTQSKSLKDFSNIKEQLLLGSRLELSEQMCKEKLDACSNLYGGGDAGLSELVDTMSNTTDQKIAQDCQKALQEYARDICMVPLSDIVHGYPFACRVYAPGEQKYATIKECNEMFTTQSPIYGGGDGDGDGGSGTVGGSGGYNCPAYKKYTSCKAGSGTPGTGYYMTVGGAYNGTPVAGNACSKCPDDCKCSGGTAPADCTGGASYQTNSCGNDYIGSLYQKLVRYALQTCVRPSQANEVIPTTVLADVNVVMDSIKVQMGAQLAVECERLKGIWINLQFLDNKNNENPMDETPDGKDDATGDKLLEEFYSETSSNPKWGYCKKP
jgi:hypothetical protein